MTLGCCIWGVMLFPIVIFNDYLISFNGKFTVIQSSNFQKFLIISLLSDKIVLANPNYHFCAKMMLKTQWCININSLFYELLETLRCPYCKSTKNTLLKSWHYGPGKSVKVSHYECLCGKTYMFYESKKNSWIIPKIKTQTSQ